MKPIQSWLTNEERATIYSSKYWNDIEEEKGKPWWIVDSKKYNDCEKYLQDSGLLDEYYTAERYIIDQQGNALKVLDLAAGIGWTSALLSRLPNVAEIHAVEISKHRLSDLFENAFIMLSGNEDKVFRYLGSFYDLKIEDNSMDIIFLSQAFHHADKPFKLLAECDRVLKKGGLLLLVGEPHIKIKQIIKQFVVSLLKERKITTNFYDLFPADDILGDRYYRRYDYYFLLRGYGYEVRHEITKSGNAIYIANK